MHRVRVRACLFAALACVVSVGAGRATGADEPAYASGRSTVEIEGLTVELNVPEGLSKEDPASLIVILHGSGGTAVGMAGTLHHWAKGGYLVCAPKSKGQVWTTSDLNAVLRIAAHLKKALPIDPRRVHVIGFSNGGWNLGPLAFDDDLRPCSATWVASGCTATKVPKWARTGLGVLALAGANDANARSARATVKVLAGSVRTVGVRLQSGLAHQWPGKLMPYFRWWVDAMDGRFVPGVDMNFAWGESIDRALAALQGRKKGGVLVYVYDASDAEKPLAKSLQNEMFMDVAVQHYGRQLQAVKLDHATHKDALEAYGVTSTPAIVVLDATGKKKRVLLEKKLKTKKIAVAFKLVAPNKKKPGK